jgi:hypothetical protein
MKNVNWRETPFDTGAPSMNPAAMGDFAKQAGGKLGSMSKTSRGTGKRMLGAAGEGLGNAGVGAGIGASIGSVIPGIGTVIGGAIGAIGGAVVGVLHYIFGHAARKLTADEQNLLNRGIYINKTRHLPGAFQDAVLCIYNPTVYRLLRDQRHLPSEIEAQLLQKNAYAAHAAAIDRLYGARIRREVAHLPPELRTLVGVSTVTGHSRELYIALHRALDQRALVAQQAAAPAHALYSARHRALAGRLRFAIQAAPEFTPPPPEGPDAPAPPEQLRTPGPEIAEDSAHDPFRDLPLAGAAEQDVDASGALDDLAIALEKSRQSQRRYLRDSWVKDTWLGDFLHVDEPDDRSAPIAPAPSPGSGRPPAITLVPEPDTGDIVDEVDGKGLALARLRPFLRARRLQAVAPGEPLTVPEERVFNWSLSWDTREAFYEAFGRRYGGRVLDLMLARGWLFVEIVPENQDAGAVGRTYTAQGDETPQGIARRYDALARERWASELRAANPERDWTARIYAGDTIAIPEVWPQPFWGAAKERGYLDASGPNTEESGALTRTYSAEGSETPQAIAKRYDALSRERWAAELQAANPQRDWSARVNAGDVIAIPDAWPQPFWGAAKERGFLDASGPAGTLAAAIADPFIDLSAERARQGRFGTGRSS